MARCRVAAVAELEPESLRRVEAGGIAICLAHAEDGNFYAISDVCTHEEYSLSDGDLWDMAVECPQHGSRFDLRDGHVTGLPAVFPAKTYPVTVEAGDVYVDV